MVVRLGTLINSKRGLVKRDQASYVLREASLRSIFKGFAGPPTKFPLIIKLKYEVGVVLLSLFSRFRENSLCFHQNCTFLPDLARSGLAAHCSLDMRCVMSG
jgi:hypothetical protein